MTVAVSELTLKLPNVPATPETVCYRPPCWPPPASWIVSEDAQGNPLSQWGDTYWDFSAWAGCSFRLYFAGGHHKRSAPYVGAENQQLLKLLTTWIMWGPRGTRSWTSLKQRFNLLRRIFVLCEREGILADSLERYPRLLENLPSFYSNSVDQQNILITLDRLLRAKEHLGFALLDQQGIKELSQSFRELPASDTEQTAYIPPRIWTYQILRLRECLDDYLAHRQQIADCFNFCIDAYAHNFGSLTTALATRRPLSTYLPFTKQKIGAGAKNGRRFYDGFESTAARFGISGLLRRWIYTSSARALDIKSFTAYLTLIQVAGISYIANFTLQRKEEVGALRTDCLMWETIPGLGTVPIIRGETTKTEPDDDARWPTSPSVAVAIDAMRAVTDLRMRCASANPEVACTDDELDNPYLYHVPFEPWSSIPGKWKRYSTRPTVQSYQAMTARYPRLFDPEQLRITEQDLTAARMFTPNLDKDGKFKVGEVWPLAYHQLRRTGAINMFASGLLSESSIQVIMKHLTLLQTRYYGQNFSRVRFNEDYETLTDAARYEVMARQIQALVSDRYVSPLGELRKQEILMNLVSTKDFKALAKAGEKNEVSFRATRLGGCVKRGDCEYGGIESIARCAGGDGGKPCRDAIYDAAKKPSAERQAQGIEQRLKDAHPDSPREHALRAELRGLRNYIDAIR
jgi:hypothetical protein